MRRGGGRSHRRARRGSREAGSHARNVHGNRSRPAATAQMRIRSQGPAQSRKSVSATASLCRAGPYARTCRTSAFPRSRTVLRGGVESACAGMPDILKPADVKHVEQAVQWALTEGKTLEIAGGGTKRPIGRPTQVDLTL